MDLHTTARLAMLEQQPEFPPEATVWEQAREGDRSAYDLLDVARFVDPDDAAELEATGLALEGRDRHHAARVSLELEEELPTGGAR